MNIGGFGLGDLSNILQREQNNYGNILSPLSVGAALDMLLNGARGETERQMEKNESKNVPMMFQHGRFKTANIENPPLQVLELPCGDDLSIIILLPKDTGDGVFSFKKLASSITYKNAEEWTSSSNMSLQKVNVHLPRFKVEEEYDLQTTLKSMGMTLPFDKEKSDLSGILQEPLVVSKATHKCFVEVNEADTEGGAGSGVVAAPLNDQGPGGVAAPLNDQGPGGVAAPLSDQGPVDFVAHHPFAAVINDSRSKTILFLGKYSCP